MSSIFDDSPFIAHYICTQKHALEGFWLSVTSGLYNGVYILYYCCLSFTLYETIYREARKLIRFPPGRPLWVKLGS